MTDNRETIEMLKMLKEQALKSHNDTAVLEVKIDSFNFVLDEAIKALEQNVKLKEAIEKMDEWVHSGNRGNCDYFIVDQIEEIINGLKKDGMVSECQEKKQSIISREAMQVGIQMMSDSTMKPLIWQSKH